MNKINSLQINSFSNTCGLPIKTGNISNNIALKNTECDSYTPSFKGAGYKSVKSLPKILTVLLGLGIGTALFNSCHKDPPTVVNNHQYNISSDLVVDTSIISNNDSTINLVDTIKP